MKLEELLSVLERVERSADDSAGAKSLAAAVRAYLGGRIRSEEPLWRYNSTEVKEC